MCTIYNIYLIVRQLSVVHQIFIIQISPVNIVHSNSFVQYLSHVDALYDMMTTIFYSIMLRNMNRRNTAIIVLKKLRK